MAAEMFLRRTHRVIAILFLVSIPPAAYFSFTATGDDVSPVVYFPLVPLLGLALTGTYHVRDLLEESWRRRDTKRLIRELDDGKVPRSSDR